jgi:hypothetical protein
LAAIAVCERTAALDGCVKFDVRTCVESSTVGPAYIPE